LAKSSLTAIGPHQAIAERRILGVKADA